MEGTMLIALPCRIVKRVEYIRPARHNSEWTYLLVRFHPIEEESQRYEALCNTSMTFL